MLEIDAVCTSSVHTNLEKLTQVNLQENKIKYSTKSIEVMLWLRVWLNVIITKHDGHVTLIVFHSEEIHEN